jgi:signal transduction histidine kinase
VRHKDLSINFHKTVAAILLLFLFAQLPIYLYFRSSGLNFLNGFTFIAKSDQNFAGLSYLSKRLDEFEKMNFLKCYRVSATTGSVLLDSTYKGECKSTFSLPSISLSKELSLQSGETLFLEAEFLFPIGLGIALEILAACLCVISILFGAMYFRKLKLAQITIGIRQKRIDEFNRLARQIQHDAKGPLSVLNVLSSKTDLGDEMKALLEIASQRISISLDELSSQHTKEIFEIDQLIEKIVGEAKELYGVKIARSGTSIHRIAVNENHFLRILSNLVKNAIEAHHPVEKELEIAIYSNDFQSIIKLKDRGMGIPEHVVHSLGEEPYTFGKQSGHGLGISDAIRKIKSWGGGLSFEGGNGSGTTVIISLPKVSTQACRSLL